MAQCFTGDKVHELHWMRYEFAVGLSGLNLGSGSFKAKTICPHRALLLQSDPALK